MWGEYLEGDGGEVNDFKAIENPDHAQDHAPGTSAPPTSTLPYPIPPYQVEHRIKLRNAEHLSQHRHLGSLILMQCRTL